MIFPYYQIYQEGIDLAAYNTQSRREELIMNIIEYFDPEPDILFILDPCIEVVDSIIKPIENGKMDEETWSLLLSYYQNTETKIKIITTKGLSGIQRYIPKINLNEKPIAFNYKGLNLEICQFINPDRRRRTKYELHDRWILYKKDRNVKAIHLGPSIGDIHNKDITMSIMNEADTIKAFKIWEKIWEIFTQKR